MVKVKIFSFDMCWTADGIPNDSSDSEMEDRTTANLAALKLDEWLSFKLEPEVSCFLVVWYISFIQLVWIYIQYDGNYILNIELLVLENATCFSVFIGPLYILCYIGVYSNRRFEKPRCGAVFKHGNIWVFLCI